MPETVNQVSIFVPVLVVVALTFVAFVHMSLARTRAAREGQDPNYYKAHLGPPEPEYAAAAVRHFNILFEVPTLFYLACVVTYLLGAVNGWALIYAWAYVAGRLVQSAVHMTYNNPLHRGLGFTFSILALLVFWVNLGLAIFARL
jgi:hypothetical protein